MKNGIYYLNNSGSRWIIFKDGKKEKIEMQTTDGSKVVRTPIYYESFGNFATVCISYKGKKINVFPDTILPN